MTIEFQAWPKTPRLFRDIVITEKLDGTNSAIHISAGYEVKCPSMFELKPGEAVVDGRLWRLGAQSRRRIITPGKTTDNYGFAAWVYTHAPDLVRLLGEGLHFGEWWGRGIARKYGLQERRFSLFNTDRYDHLNHDDAALFVDSRINTVPVLYRGPFSEKRIEGELHSLRKHGSVASPGFPDPEGICVYHTQSKQVYKVTLDNNDKGKWQA